MPATRAKPNAIVAAAEVLTLAEAAEYLRIEEELLRGMAEAKQVPGRKLGEQWRFLKTGLQEWLRGAPSPGEARPGLPEQAAGSQNPNEAFLRLAGTWKDDPDIEEMLLDIYRARGRSRSELEDLRRELHRARSRPEPEGRQ